MTTCLFSNIKQWMLTQGLRGLCLQSSTSPCSRVGFTYRLRYSSVASLEGKGSITATERKNVGVHNHECSIMHFLTNNSICEYVWFLLFGNMNLISLSAAWNESLPWSAFFRSEVPYFALRLGENTPHSWICLAGWLTLDKNNQSLH